MIIGTHNFQITWFSIAWSCKQSEVLDAADPQNSRFPAFVELAGNFFWGSGSLTIRLFPPYVIFLTYFLMVNNTYYFSKEDHHDF